MVSCGVGLEYLEQVGLENPVLLLGHSLPSSHAYTDAIRLYSHGALSCGLILPDLSHRLPI